MERRSSASPWASFPMAFAVVGATNTRSASRAKPMWAMPSEEGGAPSNQGPVPSASRSNRSVRTGPWVTERSASFVTKRRALFVRMTETRAPSRPRERTSSGVLYAAMPPVIPSRTRAPLRDRRSVIGAYSSASTTGSTTTSSGFSR